MEAISKLSQAVANVIAEGIIVATDDATPLQQVTVSVLADEQLTERERFQLFGFSALPLAGAHCLVLSLNGERSHVVVLGGENTEHRPKGLKDGESVQYSAFGALIKCDKNGQVIITTQNGSSFALQSNGDIVATPASGVLRVNGNVRATGDVVAGTISLQGHVHSGVVSGGSSTTGPQ